MSTSKRVSPLAEEIMRRNTALKSKRSQWDTCWQSLANYIQPRKNQIATKTITPDLANGTDLFDTTAVDANLVLGAGQLQYITPASERWAGYDIPENLRNRPGGAPSRLQKWYQNCSDVVMRELSRGNFYTEVHEFYLDRGGMGTGCLYAAKGRKTTLNCKSHSVGTYCIEEDDEGTVDTIFREFKLTVRQAAQRFDPKLFSGKLAKAWNSADRAKNLDNEFTFIHAVYPRTDTEREPGKQDGPNKPIASVYVCVEDKYVIRDEGYDEMPFAVSRYLTWGEEPYGYCPSIDVLATIRQVNFIEAQMDALAEKAAFPPVLVPESMDGALDLGAAGVTVFDPNEPNAMPKEWQTQGRYDIGQERVKTKQEAIRKAYHNDLFQMFAQADRQMTAYETMQRVAEKLVLFSPTFAKLTTEFLNPFLGRCFGICFREGLFQDPPPEAFIQVAGGLALVAPQVVYTSKVALAIRALENQSFVEFMNIIGPLVGIHPEIMDNFDVDAIALGLARNLSLPTAWIVDEDLRDQVRAQRAQAQEAQGKIAAAQGMAKAGADLGRAPREVQEQAMSGMRN